MVNRNLIRSLEDDSITAQVDLLLPEDEMDDMILEDARRPKRGL